MPLVLVFTKVDLIVPKASSNIAGGEDYRRFTAAHTQCEVQCRSLFGFVPAEIVSSDDSFACAFFGEVDSRRALFQHDQVFEILSTN